MYNSCFLSRRHTFGFLPQNITMHLLALIAPSHRLSLPGWLVTFWGKAEPQLGPSYGTVCLHTFSNLTMALVWPIQTITKTFLYGWRGRSTLWLFDKRVKVKVKFYRSHYRALGPELIPVYRQSARRWLFKSRPMVGCHYFSLGLQSSSQPRNVTVLRPVPSYTARWQRHIGVNNLPKVVTQLCPSGNRTHNLLIASRMPYCYSTTLPDSLIRG